MKVSVFEPPEEERKVSDVDKDDGSFIYDPYLSPPNFEVAKLHAVANRIYKKVPFVKGSKPDQMKKCPCCGLPAAGEQLPITCDLESLYHLGVGYAMHFLFIKYSIALLCLLFLIYGLFGILSNAGGDSCNESNNLEVSCARTFITKYTLANKRDDGTLLEVQPILAVIVVLMLILFFQYLRYHFRHIAHEADDHNISPSDYTVMVSHIPAAMTDKDLIKWIEAFSVPSVKIKVIKVNRAYQLNKYMDLYLQMGKLEKRHEVARKPEQKQAIRSEITQLDEKMKESRNTMEMTNIAFVSLNTPRETNFLIANAKEKVLQQFFGLITGHLNLKTRINNKRVLIHRAPEPKDINWGSLGINKKHKRIHRTLSLVILLLYSFIGLLLILIVNWSQDKLVYEGKDNLVELHALSVVASIVIYFSDSFMARLMRKLSKYEERSTQSKLEAGLAVKLSLGTFFSSAFANLVAKILIHNSQLYATLRGINFYGRGGLMQNIFVVFCFAAFVRPFVHFFDMRGIYRHYKSTVEFKKGENSKILQAEAQTLFQGRKIDISVKYAELMKVMFMTGFYASVLPMGIIFGIVALLFTYWIRKYVLLRQSVKPPHLEGELGNAMAIMLEWTLVLFTLGNLLFSSELQDSNGDQCYSSLKLQWVAFALSLLQMIVPIGKVNEYLFPIEREINERLPYHEARLHHFGTDYDMENPITRKNAILEYGAMIVMNKRRTAFAEDEDPLKRAVRQFKKKHSLKQKFGESSVPLPNLETSTPDQMKFAQSEMCFEPNIEPMRFAPFVRDQIRLFMAKGQNFNLFATKENKDEAELDADENTGLGIGNTGSPQKNSFQTENGNEISLSNFAEDYLDGPQGKMPELNKRPHPSVDVSQVCLLRPKKDSTKFSSDENCETKNN